MIRYQPSTNTKFYQKARFYRKTDTNEFAYCIEPFSGFYENNIYETTTNPNYLSNQQIDRISKIAHFGYGYKNHTDLKWYAITQLMIWQIADPSGNYYFTETLNGNKINIYDNDINEINSLITSYETLPRFNNQEFSVLEGKNLAIIDANNVLNNYISTYDNVTISNNTISFIGLKEGKYEFTIYREEKIYNFPFIFYQSNNSQNLIKTGDINKLEAKIKVNVISTKISIIKIDKESNSLIPTGESSLDGAIFTLYDNNMKELGEYEIINNQIEIKNINMNKYYLKEKTPGIGYKLSDKIYEINITSENPKVEIIVDNEVIKKKIIIEKKYGEKDNLQNESDIEFEFYNNKYDIIKTIKTDINGRIELVLPYGEYIVKQKNSTDGYEILEPFKIYVIDEEDEIINLVDYKIPIPDTHTSFTKYILNKIINILKHIC